MELGDYMLNKLTTFGLPLVDIDKYTKAGMKSFESFAKRIFFDGSTDNYYVEIGDLYTNASLGVRRGQMCLPG